MKCHYCHKICDLVFRTKIVCWNCLRCNVYFRTLTDGGLISITWNNIFLKDHEYFIKIYNGVTGNAPEFVISYFATNDQGHHYWEDIIRWNFIPNWTPSNAKRHIKKLLPFL